MQEHRPFLPHGFQFRPSDEELIKHYLKKKVLGILILLAEYFIRDWRIDRKVGSSSGAWQGEDAGKDIISGQSKVKIGSKKWFRFEKKGCEAHGAWIMHEYTLHFPKNQATNYVLCRLRKNQPTGQDKEYGSENKRKLNDFRHNSNQFEQVTDTDVERRLSGGMGFASSVTEHSGVTDQMHKHQCQ
ncbi:hypothetical protein WN943_015693 [Citrus x changshan-huyou]